jgi:hypothetical protein
MLSRFLLETYLLYSFVMEFDLVCSSCLSGDAKGKGGMSYIIFKDDLDKSIYVKSSFSIDF